MKRIQLNAGGEQCAHRRTARRVCDLINPPCSRVHLHASGGLAAAMMLVLVGMVGVAEAASPQATAITRCTVANGQQHCDTGTATAAGNADPAAATTQTSAIPNADTDVPAFAEGQDALALGNASNALGDGTSALGGGSLALERDATAIGHDASAAGASATAIGGVATVYDYDEFGFVVGRSEKATQASGEGATAVGGGAIAADPLASALGSGASADGIQSTALGYRAQTFNDGATAVGGLSAASGFLHRRWLQFACQRRCVHGLWLPGAQRGQQQHCGRRYRIGQWRAERGGRWHQ